MNVGERQPQDFCLEFELPSAHPFRAHGLLTRQHVCEEAPCSQALNSVHTDISLVSEEKRGMTSQLTPLGD